MIFPLRNRHDVSDDDKHDLALEKLTWVGLEDAIGKDPADLSGGMRKRAALARTLMTDPRSHPLRRTDNGAGPRNLERDQPAYRAAEGRARG